MNIAFINPDFAPTRSRDAMQPLVFAVLKGLTPSATIRARKQFNRIGSILHRLTDRKTNSRSAMNAILYLAANLVSRAEIRRKTGHSL